MLRRVPGGRFRLVRNGRPHWFHKFLTTIEFIIPAVFFRIVSTEEKVSRGPPG
jgi:hypothetical protein